MAAVRLDLDIDDLVERYTSGESEQAIARALGIGRPAVRRRLIEAGVEIRNRGQAMSTRMARTSPDERKRLASAANTARRGSKASAAELARKAITAEQRLQKLRLGEIDLACLLSGRGMFADLQRACGPYNIDLAFPPVAVEVHRATTHPMHSAAQRQRVVDLAEAGWRSLYVWISPKAPISYSSAAVDEIVAHIQAAQRDPSSVRDYRVIRGTGEDAP